MKHALSILVLALSGCYQSHEPSSPASQSADAGSGQDLAVDTHDATQDLSLDGSVSSPPRCTMVKRAEKITHHDETGNFNAPDIFWTGERVGVVHRQTHESTGAHGIIVMTDLDPLLTEASPIRLVGEESHGWGEAAWNGTGVGVCWNGDPPGQSGLHFREVDGVNGELGHRVFFEDGRSCYDIAYKDERYALAWRDTYSGDDETVAETVLQVINRDGTRVGERHLLSRGTYPGPSARLISNEVGFLATTRSENGLRIVQLDTSGDLLFDTETEWENLSFSTMALRGDELGVLGLEGPRETRRLTFRVLSSQTGELLKERVLLNGAPSASYPSVLARPEGWLLVWGEGSRPSSRAMMLSLDPELVPLAPRQVFYEGRHSGYGGPSMMSAENNVYVAYSHQRPIDPEYSREFTYVERWECNAPPDDPCRAQDAVVDDGSADCARSFLLGWKWNGSECSPLFDCDTGCEGEDCDTLSTSQFACESDRKECQPAECERVEAPAGEVCGPITQRSNELSWLEVEASPCLCDSAKCSVVPTAPLELSISLTTCAEDGPIDCDCIEGVQPKVRCALPPLQSGEWTINLPGRESISLTVDNASDLQHSCR